MIQYDSEIKKLSHQFYLDYDAKHYPEIERKRNRPHSMAIFENHNYYVCIPFRTAINHDNAFLFYKTSRSSFSGLDYSKMVIIKNPEYIDDKNVAIIDKDEYVMYCYNIDFIHDEALRYLQTYIDHILGIHKLHPRVFNRKYRYATLKYFHKELGI